MFNWVIQKVSDPERIFKEINDEMEHPVGVLVFGANSDKKMQVVSNLSHCLKKSFKINNASEEDLKKAGDMFDFTPNGTLIAVLSGVSSTRHEKRHKMVQIMKEIGMKTVVGVYVEIDPDIEYPIEVNTVAELLNKNPPTADGLKCLISIH